MDSIRLKGPVVSRGQFDRIQTYIQLAKEEGLTFFAGGDSDAIPIKVMIVLCMKYFDDYL